MPSARHLFTRDFDTRVTLGALSTNPHVQGVMDEWAVIFASFDLFFHHCDGNKDGDTSEFMLHETGFATFYTQLWHACTKANGPPKQDAASIYAAVEA